MRTEIKLGRTPDGTTVTIELALHPIAAGLETVTHGRTDGTELALSISGAGYEPHSFRPSSAGQILDAARQVLPSKEWSQADLDRLCDIWEQWHLNEMRAGCAHQTVVYEEGSYGERRPSLDLTPPCPVTGYRYGHGWLVNPLPADVVEDVRRFQRRLGYPGY